MENKVNDKAQVNQPTITTGEPSDVNEARRRFSKIGLTGSAVIFTLASRPVWAVQCSAVQCSAVQHFRHNVG